MKRTVSVLMLLVLLTALLAACAQQAPTVEPGEPGAAPAGESPAAESPVAAASPAAESPVAAASPAVEASPVAGADLPNVGDLDLGTIKIATQSPLSGPQSALGVAIQNGAQLAVEQLAPKMGLENIELVAFDDQAREEVGAANANTIAANQDILCVDGHLNSGVALAALPTYQNANLAMVSPANTNPRITEEFGANPAFRVVGRDDVQGVVAEDFVHENLKAESVYILHDQTAYGEGIATFFRQAAEEDGLNVVGFAGTQETSVFDAVLTPIQAANPDVVFFGGIYSQAGPLLQQMRERGLEAQFVGPDGIDSAEFARLAGDAAVGAHYTTVAGPPSAYPLAAQFARDYQQRFGSAAPSFSPQSYDAAGLCMVAIANAALEANGKPTREQVVEALRNLEPYQGVTGPIQFNEEGDRAPATYFIVSVVAADPEKWGQNEIIETFELSPPEE